MAESRDWVDEPTSESEKEISSKCLMAKLDDVADAKDTDTTMNFSAECSFSSSQVTGDHKFGLGYDKMDVDCPSSHIPSSSQIHPSSSKQPSYSLECTDSDSGDSDSVYSMDLRDSRKFGIFVSTKQTKPQHEEDQDSNDIVKPMNDIFKTLNLDEDSSSSSKKPSLFQKVNIMFHPLSLFPDP
ncbi:hypothetical protein L6452_05644 [Arctium lappa]|uniref:Uncharacterized protein n=1 Tax=Arctium lappa TaxID=4217 RepID=A0ACB9EI13_ARCLA|nr:hypothetical protein L6452_05644 [Arctium lappa]